MIDIKEEFYKFLKKHRVYRRYMKAVKLYKKEEGDNITVEEFLDAQDPSKYFTAAFIFTREYGRDNIDDTGIRFWNDLAIKWNKLCE